MTPFEDSSGHRWAIDLDAYLARQIKTLLGVDLLAPSDDLLGRLQSDIGLFVDLLEFVLRDQREALNLTERDFAKRLKGPAFERATDAFLEEFLLFFPPHRQAAMRTILAKLKSLQSRQVSHLQAVVESPQVEALFLKDLAAMEAQLTSGKPLTTGPASLDSTPTPEE